MSYAPATMTALGKYWVSQGGVNLGIVGNTRHTKGYHLGKDRIFDGSGPGIGWDDYSVKTSRDKAGLTNGASAIDLGRLDGSLTKLWAFSMALAKECMKNGAATRDVREIIFWHPGRERVVGWSDLAPDRLINDYGDLSHKTHTHISYYRDSEGRDKRPLFKSILEPVVVVPPPTTPPEEDVILSQSLPGYTCTVKKTANIRTAPSLTAKVLRVVSTPENWTIIGAVKGQVDPEGGSDQWYVRWGTGGWEYTAASNLLAPPLKPASQVELSAAKQAAADAEAKAATATTALAACNTKVANAKTALA